MGVCTIKFVVNGQERVVDIPPAERLITTLRDRLGLKGTKEGCGEGECGACTVLMDDEAVNACMVLTYQARNRSIITIEGLAKDGRIDTLQQNFIKHGAIQCGYCTPGVIMSAKALLQKNIKPSEDEIKTAIAGNLCRCTGYVNIIKAIKATAEQGSTGN